MLCHVYTMKSTFPFFRFFPSSSCYSNWTTGKGKKEKLFFFFWRFWPWCTRENDGIVDRPTRNPPIDPSHCTTPFWFICPGLNVLQKQSDHGIPHPATPSFPCIYYITSLSLMKFNQTRFWTNTFFFDSTSEKKRKRWRIIFSRRFERSTAVHNIHKERKELFSTRQKRYKNGGIILFFELHTKQWKMTSPEAPAIYLDTD